MYRGFHSQIPLQLTASDCRKTQNTGKITRFSLTYENVNETDSLQQSGCNGPVTSHNYNYYISIRKGHDINVQFSVLTISRH